MGKGTRSIRPLNAVGRGGGFRSVPTWATGWMPLGAWLCSQLGGEGSSSSEESIVCQTPRRHLLPHPALPGPHRELAMGGTLRPWARHCPPAVDHTCSLWTKQSQECRGHSGRGRRPAAWGGIAGAQAVPPSHLRRALGARVAGPPLGGISQQVTVTRVSCLSRGSQPAHPDKLDTPTSRSLTVPSPAGGQWQAPQEGAVALVGFCI